MVAVGTPSSSGVFGLTEVSLAGEDRREVGVSIVLLYRDQLFKERAKNYNLANKTLAIFRMVYYLKGKFRTTEFE